MTAIYDFDCSNIVVNVENNGPTDVSQTVLRLYDGAVLVHEEFVDVAAASNVQIQYAFSLSAPTHEFRVVVDEDDVKVESDDSNNENLQTLARKGDVDLTGFVTAADIIYMVNYVFKSGPDPQPTVENGNVNCVVTVSAADIIHLVNYIFKSGPDPCCF